MVFGETIVDRWRDLHEQRGEEEVPAEEADIVGLFDLSRPCLKKI